MDVYKNFVIKFIFSTLLAAALVLALNSAIDPLWYVKGNQFSHVNYGFNEREAKLNLFLKSPRRYDCFLFGASAATLLDASLIKRHNCFNFAFSAGNIFEYTDYAKYLKDYGFYPALIIVDVDFFDFRSKNLRIAPKLIQELKPPPTLLEAYLSWDVLDLSIKTIGGQPPWPTDYDTEFKGIILTDQLTPKWRNAPDEGKSILFNTATPVALDNVDQYRKFKNVFIRSVLIGYVPHTSAYVMAKIKFSGQLENTLRAVYETSKYFDRFYDFSVPSKTTIDSAETYDGYHFTPAITRQVADEINGQRTGASLDLHDLTFEQYDEEYNRRLSAYILSHQLTPASFHSDLGHIVDP